MFRNVKVVTAAGTSTTVSIQSLICCACTVQDLNVYRKLLNSQTLSYLNGHRLWWTNILKLLKKLHPCIDQLNPLCFKEWFLKEVQWSDCRAEWLAIAFELLYLKNRILHVQMRDKDMHWYSCSQT